MSPRLERQLALVLVSLFAAWSLIAFGRAVSLTGERPRENPALRISMWKLGGPQAEQLRSFLDQHVLPHVEQGAIVAVQPQSVELLDALSLLGWVGYFLPGNRVMSLEKLSGIDDGGPRYLLRYPGPGPESDNPKLELLERNEQGSLYRFR